jgi:hypothetical protein
MDGKRQPDSESRPVTIESNRIEVGEVVLEEGHRSHDLVQDHVFRRWEGAQNAVRRSEPDSLVYLLLTSLDGFPTRLIYIPGPVEKPQRSKRSFR